MCTEATRLRRDLALTQAALFLAVRQTSACRMDPLTGLPARSLFTAFVERELRPGRAVALLDLDALKPVNDHHGHHAGDRVLEVVGERLRGWHGREARWGRLGGDEFAGLLEVSDPGWRADLDNLIVVLAAPIELDSGAVVAVGASVGLAPAMTGCTTSQTLRAADAAMYRAKVLGGCRWRLYDPAEDGDVVVVPKRRHRPRHRTRGRAGALVAARGGRS